MIREIAPNEVDRIFHLAREFTDSSRFLQRFDPDVSRRNWRGFIESGMGVVFVLESETGIYGMLGGLAFPDIHNGVLTASEMFWFVSEKRRGRGLLLLREFERWAIERGCKRINMAYMCDLMPDKVRRVYERFGYEAAEAAYTKEVS